jgi:prepilin-type N-terminal cleavage/methylation domain-containing protein
MHSTCATCRSSPKRKGFTLLEVLLALAILLFSLAAIGNLSFVGMKASARCHLQSEACWHAHTVLEEIGAGIRKPVTAGPMPIEAGSAWMVKIRARPTDIPRLTDVEVQVWKAGSQAEQSRVGLAKTIYDREL